ncbi:MAG: nicotinate (nicotinamide) nucleotide adenylyltransferase [Candidatus Omnitrophica bacterium]|nr:nicotinate (nicotinamide) nucleotide adenylyltransferase [Candidatus Omnitrophota bacterium]
MGLDKILFIPTNISPHKEIESANVYNRFEMIKLAVAGNECFEVLDLEVKREGVSYTIDTVKEVKRKYPDQELYLIIGSDLANDFSDWKDYEEIKKIVKVVVACRKSFPLKEKGDFVLSDVTQIEISSSKIRNFIREGHDVKYFVNTEVLNYIKKHELYSRKEEA